MNKTILFISFIKVMMCFNSVQGQNDANTNARIISPDAKAKSDADQEKKAAEWVTSLTLNDAAKETRLKEVIATHLKTIRDWHNEHPFTTVPAGINPVTKAFE